jgi:hypothetical protein
MSEISERTAMDVFRASTLEEMLQKEELHIPLPASLPLDDSGETFPCYFIADEVFPLRTNLMRSYPRRMLTNKKVYLNTNSLVPEKL